MKSQTKVLFATRTSPFPGESGSGTYVFDLLRHLNRQGFRIHVVWTEPPDLVPSRGWYNLPAAAKGIVSLEMPGSFRFGEKYWMPSVVWLPLKARLSYAVKSILRSLRLWREKSVPSSSSAASPGVPSGQQPAWGAAASPAEIASVHAAATRFKPDVVIANYAWMAQAAAATGLPRVVLSHDVRHRQLVLADGKVMEDFGEFMSREAELVWLQHAQGIIAIQKMEAAVFASLLPGIQVVTAPMAVAARVLPPSPASALLFVGSQHRANIDGLNWFIQNVWPLVRRELPGARLKVAGTISSVLTGSEGVEILGRLPDLTTAYAQASAVIAPLLKGSGIKIKILEAISFGRACITTSVGAEGLEEFRPALDVCDDAASFAAVAVQYLRRSEIAVERGNQLAALAGKYLSSDACYDPVAGLLRKLADA